MSFDDDRDAMLTALQHTLVAALHARGFSGSLPHLRRARLDRFDLVTVHFDRGGGGFVVEIGQRPSAGITASSVPPDKVVTYHAAFADRARLQPRRGTSTAAWFRFDRAPWWRRGWVASPGAGRFARAAAEATALLAQADAWWEGRREQPNIVPLDPGLTRR
jgi:Domain of unknown function (DUF4304)